MSNVSRLGNLLRLHGPWERIAYLFKLSIAQLQLPDG